MAKKLDKGGLKLVAGGPGRRPMVWRVTAAGLSRTYTFTPGVATYVEPEDLSWFADPDNLGERVLEVVAPEVDAALAPVVPASTAGRGAPGRTSSAQPGTTATAGAEGGGGTTADTTTDKG